MKVLYNYQAFSVFRGGVARIFIELSKYGFSQEDVHLSVFSGFNRSRYLQEDHALRDKCCGVYIPQPLGKLRLLTPLNRLVFAIYSPWVSADICHHAFADIPHVPRHSKTVITIYDLIEEIYDPRGLDSPIAKKRRKALNLADGIICISENTKRDLLRLYPEASNKRIAVIYCGNDLHKVPPSPLEHAGPYLLYVGMRKPAYKNFGVLLRSLSHNRSLEEHSLICFGGGAFASDELSLIRDHGLSGRVFQTTGSDAKLAGYYKNAFALIYPSTYEGFGIPTVEAMSLGCPVVSSNAPPMPEVNGDGALYFSPDHEDELSACLEKLRDGNVRRQCMDRGRERAALFTWKDTCKQTFAFYRTILK